MACSAYTGEWWTAFTGASTCMCLFDWCPALWGYYVLALPFYEVFHVRMRT